MSKISIEIIDQIRRMHAQGATQSSLAKHFGVDRATIHYWIDEEYRTRKNELNRFYWHDRYNSDNDFVSRHREKSRIDMRRRRALSKIVDDD